MTGEGVLRLECEAQMEYVRHEGKQKFLPITQPLCLIQVAHFLLIEQLNKIHSIVTSIFKVYATQMKCFLMPNYKMSYF